MKTLPPHLEKYEATPSFDQDHIPKAMLKSHTTKEGVWGLIVIERGELEYEIIQSGQKHALTPGVPGVVEPEVEHCIRPTGDVEFRIEFYQLPQAKAKT